MLPASREKEGEIRVVQVPQLNLVYYMYHPVTEMSKVSHTVQSQTKIGIRSINVASLGGQTTDDQGNWTGLDWFTACHSVDQF